MPADAVHAALVNGFHWVMLYGGLGVWVLAALSFVLFGAGKSSAKPCSDAQTHAI